MSSTTRRKVFICPKCGVPNIEGDRKCMYCETRFTGIGALFTIAISRLRKNRPFGFIKSDGWSGAIWIIKKIAGGCLIVFGLYLFAMALMSGQFKDWIIAVILLGYGGVLIKK